MEEGEETEEGEERKKIETKGWERRDRGGKTGSEMPK